MAERTLLHQEVGDQSSLRLSRCEITHMIRGSGRIWARGTIALAKIGMSFGYIPQRGATQVAGQLEVRVTTSGNFDEVAFCRGMAQVTVLIKGATVGIWHRHDVVE